MKRYSKKQIKNLKQARRAGASIHQLMEKFKMPKTTVWHHIHDIKLDETMMKKIRSRQGGSRKRSDAQWKLAETQSSKVLSNSRLRELALIGSMLYWAEGNKGSLVFTNTDPYMLRLFMSFLEKCLDIDKNECRLLIRTATPIIPERALKYWCDQLDIDLENAKIDWNDKNNKTKTEFGICRIWVVKSGYHFKVLQCMIESLKAHVV